MNTKAEAIKLVAAYMPTEPERRLFLRLMFGRSMPEALSRIDLSGSPANAAINMLTYFEKNQMDGSLMACMRTMLPLEGEESI